jgi:hypothetical protein
MNSLSTDVHAYGDVIVIMNLSTQDSHKDKFNFWRELSAAP